MKNSSNSVNINNNNNNNLSNTPPTPLNNGSNTFNNNINLPASGSNRIVSGTNNGGFSVSSSNKNEKIAVSLQFNNPGNNNANNLVNSNSKSDRLNLLASNSNNPPLIHSSNNKNEKIVHSSSRTEKLNILGGSLTKSNSNNLNENIQIYLEQKFDNNKEYMAKYNEEEDCDQEDATFRENIKYFFANLIPTWVMILSSASILEKLEEIIKFPGILCTLFIFIIYFFGYNLNITACIVVVICTLNVLNRVTRLKKRERYQFERKKRNDLQNEFGETRETANWLNNYLEAAYGNHHKYISYLFVRFANPLLMSLCRPYPIESLAFQKLNIGPTSPKLSNLQTKFVNNELIFDFDVNYVSSFKGVMLAKLYYTPLVPVYLCNLNFRARMGFVVTFATEKFPFISNLKWQLVDRPDIDISVKAPVLPHHITDKSITEKFVLMVSDEMCNHILRPKAVEGDFSEYVKYDPNCDIFISSIQWLIKEMTKHTSLSREAELPDKVQDIEFLGVVSSVMKQMAGINTTEKESKKRLKKKHRRSNSEDTITLALNNPHSTLLSDLETVEAEINKVTIPVHSKLVGTTVDAEKKSLLSANYTILTPANNQKSNLQNNTSSNPNNNPNKNNNNNNNNSNNNNNNSNNSNDNINVMNNDDNNTMNNDVRESNDEAVVPRLIRRGSSMVDINTFLQYQQQKAKSLESSDSGSLGNALTASSSPTEDELPSTFVKKLTPSQINLSPDPKTLKSSSHKPSNDDSPNKLKLSLKKIKGKFHGW